MDSEQVEDIDETAEMTPEEAAKALPLEFDAGPRPVRMLAPGDSGARASQLVGAVRLYHEDPTIGGAACAALLWAKLGRRAKAGTRAPRDYGADAFDALVGDGWTVAQAVQLGELAALHCGLYVARLNTKEAETF